MKTSGNPSLLKIGLLMLMFVSYSDTYVFSKPRGGQVVSGTASFTQDGNLTVITAGNRSVINYTGFDIGKGETVQFVQPNAHSTVLNRVTTADPTNIFGTLQANGIVVISNPYGVFFQNGSVVNVGGLIAGAGHVSAADFTRGKVHFTDLSGDVRNDGVIAADNQIALMGANVANTGAMTAAHGVAMMVSGQDVYVGDKNGNVFVKANGRAIQAQTTKAGDGSTGSVTNTGTVAAPRVLLGAGDMYSTAIVNSGLLQGRSIAVNAGKNGSATVGGTLDATSARTLTASGKGGRIDVLGGTVALKGATLDASGDSGGSVRVGGDFHGAPTVAASTTTTVDAASTIKADATGATGNGGTVVLWSGNSTAFDGNISARGAAGGGNGGSVEVSSHGGLLYRGLTDLRAPAGAVGSLLLDPTNIVIDSVLDLLVDYGYPTGTTTITTLALGTQLSTGNVILTADNDIIFRADVTANSNANSLTLGAGHSIYIGDPGSNPLNATTPPPATSAALTLGGAFTATYNSTGAAAGVTNARFRMAGTSSITTPGTVTISDGGTNAGNIPGIFAQNITTSTGTAGGTSGSIVLDTSLGANEPITLGGPLVASANGGVGTNTTGGNVTLTASGAIVGATNTITTNGTGTQAGGAIALTANGGIAVGDLTARGRSTGLGGSVTLTSSATTAGAAGSFVTGNIDTSAAGAAGGPIAIGAPAVVADFRPTSLTVGTLNTAGNTTANGGSINLQTSGLLTFSASATPSFTGDTTLFANTTNATSFTPNGYSFSLTLNGASISTSAVIGAVNNLTLASPSAPFGINVDGNVTTNGGQNYFGTTTVTAAAPNVALTAGASTAAAGINFNGTLDDNANGTHNLALIPGSAGGTLFAAAVGGIHPLLSLTATTRTTGATTTNDEPVTVNGVAVQAATQQYGSLILGGAAGAMTSLIGANITSGPVTGNAHPLTVTASGTGTFAAITGAGDLLFNGTGVTALNGAITATSLTATGGTGLTLTLPAGGSVTTTGEQNYNEALTLGAAAILTGQGTAANASTALRFGAGISGAFALTLSNTASGVAGVDSNTLFAAGAVSIGSLSVSAVGTSQLNNGGITTSAVAGQVYNGPVTLGATTALTANAAGVVNFANNTATLGSAGTPQALTITTTGATTFGAAVGGAPGAGGTAVTTAPALASLNVTGGGAVNVNGGSVTTVTSAGGSQTYSGQVVLGANTTFKGNTATFTGGITSSAAAGNPFNLTLDLSSLVTLPGTALTGIRDFASVGSGGVLLNGNVSTYGSQTYSGGAVTIAGNVTLTAGTTATTGSITLGSAVDDQTNGAHSLTLIAGSAGSVTITSPIGAAHPLLSLTAATLNGGGVEPVTINGVGITTTGAQQYGTLNLAGAAGAATTLVGGNISSGTVTGNAHPLIVTASGTGTFAGITGAGDLTFNGAGATALNGAITATSLTATGGTGLTLTLPAGGSVTTTGEQNYNEALTLGAAAILTGQGTAANASTALRFGAGISGAFALTLSNTASGVAGVDSNTLFAAGAVSIGSLSVSAVGTSQLNNGGITTSAVAGQVYNGPVTLGANATLTAGTGVVTFGQTLESAGTGTAQTLAISTSGATTFGGRVGGAPGLETEAITNAPALASITTTGGGAVNVNGGSVTTVTGPTGTQSYSGQVVIGADTVFKGYSLTLGNGITSGAQAGNPFSLTLDLFGPVTFPGALSLTGIRDFTSEGPGAVLINGNVTTTGNQTYRNGLVTIGANVILTAGTTIPTGSISLGSAVNDQTSGAHTLTLITGTSGGTTINAPIGGTVPLQSLTATARQTTAQPTTANQPVTINATTVTTTGAQNYGALVLGGTGLTTLGGSAITSGPVTGNSNPLTVNATGSTNFGAITGAGALNFNVAGTATFASINDTASVATTGGSAVFGPLTATDVTATGAGTAIFNGTVNATSLTVSGGTGVTLNAGTITTTGEQNYNEPAILGSAETLTGQGTTANGGIAVRFASTLTGAFALILTNTASGVAGVGSDTIFGGAVGTLASLATSAVGTTQINGGSITTNGAAGQVYNGVTTLGANTTLAAGAGPINFATANSTLGSAGTPRALTINTSGITTFTAQVGGTSTAGVPALASLATSTGEVDIKTGVTTLATVGGFQNYGGSVHLTGDTTLQGYSLALNGGLLGQGNSLALNFTTQVGVPGGMSGLNNFITTGAGGALLGGTFSTGGNQTYSGGPVVLGAASTLTSTGGSLTFNTPVDGNFALTLNANGAGGQAIFNTGALVGNGTAVGAFTSNTAGGTFFNMNAGSSTSGKGGVNAGSVSITGPVTFNEAGSTLPANTHPSVLTSGPQAYAGAATLAQDTSLVSTGTGGGGAIAFNAAAATIDSASSTLRALNTSTAGTQTFTGLIGAAFGLSGLTTGTGATVFNMSIPSTNPAVAPAGVRVFGPVTTTGPVTFNVANSTLAQPSVLTLLNGAQIYGALANPTATVVTLAGPVTVLNSANTESPLGTFNGGGTITFNGNIVATAATPELDVRAGVGTVEFDQAINITGDFAPGGASVIFRGAIGTAANPLGTFTVLPNNGSTGTPGIDLNGGSVTTGGTQTFAFPTVLSANTILQAGTAGGTVRNIIFSSTLDGSNLLNNNPYTLNLSVNGGIIAFNGIVGGIVPLASLTTGTIGATLATTQFNMVLPAQASGQGGVNVLGAVAINTNADFEATGSTAPTILSGVTYNSVTGTGTQTYGTVGTAATVTVGTDTVLRDLATPGGITFNGKVDAKTDGGASLSVNAVGDESFNQLVGSTQRLSTLSTDAVGTVGGATRFNMNLTPAGTVAGVRTTGAVNVNDQVVFNATGGTTLPTILSGGAQNFQLAATLNTDAVLTATSGDITFFGTVDSASAATPRALAVNTPGDEIFHGLVGYTTPLFNLTTDSTAPATGEARFLMTRPSNAPGGPTAGGVNVTGNVTVNDGVFFDVGNTLNTTPFQPSVSSGGSQTYGGPATLGTQTVLTSVAGDVAFNSTVDSETPGASQDMTIATSAGHTITFASPVGTIVPLATLRTTTTGAGVGTTRINGGIVNTTGSQLYDQAVTIDQDTVLTSTGPTDGIVFNASLDGTHNLTVNGAGYAIFAAVGNTSPLLNLTVTTLTGTSFNYTPSLISAGNADVNIAGALSVNGPVFFNAGGAGSVVFVRTGVTVVGLTPVPTSAQDYFGPFTLTGIATFTDLRSGAITFHDVVNGSAPANASDLTASTGGTISFLSPVGTTTPLTSLTTSNLGLATGRTIISGGSIVTTGTQTYNDAVFVDAAPTTLMSTNGGDITFASTLDSLTATARELTVNTAGRTIFGGAVGAINALASLTTDNETPTDLGTQLNGGSVKTTGAQTYNDTVTLGAAGAATSLTSTGGGDITFVRTLDSNAPATPQALTVNTAGRTIFGGAVGAINALASLTTDNETPTDLGTFINGGGVTTINTSTAVATGAQTYNDAVTLGANTVLKSTVGGAAAVGGDLKFNGTVDGSFDLTLNTSALTVFNAPVGNATALTALTTNAVGSTQFNMPVGATAGVVVVGPVTINDPVLFNSQGATLAQPTILTHGNGSQTYNGAATLATSTYLVTAAGPGTGGVYNGGGGIFFNSATGISGGFGGFLPVDLYVRAGFGDGNIAGSITARDVDISGALVNFAGPINLSGTFSVEPNADSFGGDLNFGGGFVFTAGVQNYNSAFVIGTDTVLNGGSIFFGGRVDSAPNTHYSLTINSQSEVLFSGPVGNRNALQSLTTDAGGQTNFAFAGTADKPSVTTVGAQIYNDAVALQAATVLRSSNNGALTFGSTVDGGYALSLGTGGVATFRDVVGGVAPLASLTTQTGEVDLNGGAVTTTGTQSYGGAVVLGADTLLTSTASTDLGVAFALTLNSDATARALTINSVGLTRFAGAVGGSSPLASLRTLGAGAVAINGGAVTTFGLQRYGGAVTLGAAARLVSNNNDTLTFNSTVDGAFALTIKTGGLTTFRGAVGGSAPLASLTTQGVGPMATQGAGPVAINGGAVKTTGLQNYGGAVTLGADTLLTSTAGTGGGITFGLTLNSDATARSLTINSVGLTTFANVVGGSAPLASLTTQGAGPVAINGGAVTTVGLQNYGGTVTLGTTTLLTSLNNGDITFVKTLDSNAAATPQALMVNTGGTTIFGGAVGGTAALASVVTDAPGTTQINGGGVTTISTGAPGVTGAQTYNDAVTLGADATLASTFSGSATAGDITFVKTLASGTAAQPSALTINAGARVFFGGAVGGNGLPLASLTINPIGSVGGRVVFNFEGNTGAPSVTTNNGQTYNGAVTLRVNTALQSTNGSIAFGQTVDSSNNNNARALTLNAAKDETFGGRVGGTFPLTSLTTDDTSGPVSGGHVIFNVSGGGQSVTTRGAQIYNDAATLQADTSLKSMDGDALTFASKVDGTFALSLNTSGTTTFRDAVGAVSPLAGVVTDAGGTTRINGGGVTTINNSVTEVTGAQTYNDTVTFGSDSVKLTSGVGNGVAKGGDITFAQQIKNQTVALTLSTPKSATVFDQSVELKTLTAEDGSAVQIAGGSVLTHGLQTYGGALTITAVPPLVNQTVLKDDGTAPDTGIFSPDTGIIFKQSVTTQAGSLVVLGNRILAGTSSNFSVAVDLVLDARDRLVLQGDSFTAAGRVILNDPADPTYASTAAGYANGNINQPFATIYLLNSGRTAKFVGSGFDMGFRQNLFAQGSVSITATNGGIATLSDISAVGSLSVTAGTITLRAREADSSRGDSTDDGLNFVSGGSINFGQSPINYVSDSSSANNHANLVTSGGQVTVNRNQVNGISLFQDPTVRARLSSAQTTDAGAKDFTPKSGNVRDLDSFGLFLELISSGSKSQEIAAALSGALPDQKPLDVSSDITVTASQMEELKKLGIHPRTAQKQERLSLTSKRALFAQLVDGLDTDNYGRLQPVKGGISRLVPSDYVVVVDRMSEREVQSILAAFEELYGKNKEKAPPIGEAFNTAFTDYSTEKQTADPAGFAPYLAGKPGKYPDVDKAVRGFDNLFGYIESLGLTPKEQAKSKEHIASDLQVSGVSPEDMVKVIDALRTKIPKDQKAPSTKLPPSPPAANPAPGATSPAPPEQKKGTPPLKTARHGQKEPARQTVRRNNKPSVTGDRLHEVAGL